MIYNTFKLKIEPRAGYYEILKYDIAAYISLCFYTRKGRV